MDRDQDGGEEGARGENSDDDDDDGRGMGWKWKGPPSAFRLPGSSIIGITGCLHTEWQWPLPAFPESTGAQLIGTSHINPLPARSGPHKANVASVDDSCRKSKGKHPITHASLRQNSLDV